MSKPTDLQNTAHLTKALDRLAAHTLVQKESRGLPIGAEAATAAILNKLACGEFAATAESFAALREANLALLSDSPDGIRESLGRQCALLEALFHHLSARGLAANGTEAQSRLIHAAIGAQQAGLRTLVALGALA